MLNGTDAGCPGPWQTRRDEILLVTQEFFSSSTMQRRLQASPRLPCPSSRHQNIHSVHWKATVLMAPARAIREASPSLIICVTAALTNEPTSHRPVSTERPQTGSEAGSSPELLIFKDGADALPHLVCLLASGARRRRILQGSCRPRRNAFAATHMTSPRHNGAPLSCHRCGGILLPPHTGTTTLGVYSKKTPVAKLQIKLS